MTKMRHHIFETSERYKVALLMKASAFGKHDVLTNYVKPLVDHGVPMGQQIAFNLPYNDAGKAPAGFIKDYLSELLPVLGDLGVEYLYVADAAYFKVLAGAAKADPLFGYVLECKAEGYKHMKVVLGLNHQQLVYNPALQTKLDLSLSTLACAIAGTYIPIGTGIIHKAYYPQTLQEIQFQLDLLHQHPELTCDIEAFSLAFDQAGIGTIAFAWNQHEGVAFACDYQPIEPLHAGGSDGLCHGRYGANEQVQQMLRHFFESYQGKLTFHNATFDTKVLIYTLWMKDLLDQEGLLKGLDILYRGLDDTKIIAYLATNSTAGNVLGLKALAHEFAGNWAVEVTDIRKVPLADLLRYNLVDCLSTWYVKNKYIPVMEADRQRELYDGLMMPSQKLITQMELTGMPLDPKRVQEVKAELTTIQQKHLDTIFGSGVIETLNLLLQESEWDKDYQSRRAKAKNPLKIQPKDIAEFRNVTFNPNSGPQMQRLLYEQMGLPIIDKTDSGQPAVGADTLEKLVNHTENEQYKAIIKALMGYSEVTKILSTFISAFERAITKGDNSTVWLHGCFNLGGTVSGRLSSSDPNLQNIPAKSTYGELIKTCFVAPVDWLFAGADFNSLEDYISALTTKDPNKLKVYIDGFDGHALRAAFYFKDELVAEGILIDMNDPKSVNRLKKEDHWTRQESKVPTFALTYGGTHYTLMQNLGWAEEKAKKIEANYHELYKVSDEYVASRLKQANVDGYVEVAFGLRVRTPLIAQVMWNTDNVPYEAKAEGRTAGNAMGQSYGLLNNRAAVEFFQKVWASKYRYDILPVALIHDAIYILVRDDLEVVEWANKELIKSMRWQELPEIQHDTVKLGAALDIFWPSWASATTLPNDADQDTILKLCQETRTKHLH